MAIVNEIVRATRNADIVRETRIYDHVMECPKCDFGGDVNDLDVDYGSFVRVIAKGEIVVIPVEIDVDCVNDIENMY